MIVRTHLGKVDTDTQCREVHTPLVQPNAHHQQQRDDDHKRHNEQPSQVGAGLAVHVQAVEVLAVGEWMG